jgi:N utilization substance protein B
MARSLRKAREAALVTLYQLDLMKARLDPATVAVEVSDGMGIGPEQKKYAVSVVTGIASNRSTIDEALSDRLEGYDLTRVAAVDRAVLRVAAYEILFIPSMAPAITVNEAVEIAKRYSTAESGHFVNGVLRRLVRETDKANWDISMAPPDEEEEPEESEPEVVEEQLDPELEETQQLLKVGWKIKSAE